MVVAPLSKFEKEYLRFLVALRAQQPLSAYFMRETKEKSEGRVLTFETSKKRTYVNIGSFFAGVP